MRSEIMENLDKIRLLRLKQIIGDANANPPIPGLIPLSRSSWYLGIQKGIYPPPIRLGGGASFWRLRDIEDLINNAESD